MKTKGFFSRLIAALFAGHTKRPTRDMVRSARRKLMARDDLRAAAQEAGNQRRLADHNRSVIGGYRAKIAKVKAGTGNHTLTGIPPWFLQREGLL